MFNITILKGELPRIPNECTDKIDFQERCLRLLKIKCKKNGQILVTRTSKCMVKLIPQGQKSMLVMYAGNSKNDNNVIIS